MMPRATLCHAFSVLTLTIAVAAAPQMASARTIQAAYTGVVTYSRVDDLGLIGASGALTNGPTVSGNIIFETAGVTPVFLDYGYGSEWRHFNSTPGSIRMTASFVGTLQGTVGLALGAGVDALQMYYSNMPWGRSSSMNGSDGRDYFGFSPIFTGVTPVDPSDTASLWSVSVAGGTMQYTDYTFEINWGASGAREELVGSITSMTLTDITASASTAVPEPASMALFGFGLAGLSAARRRRAG